MVSFNVTSGTVQVSIETEECFSSAKSEAIISSIRATYSNQCNQKNEIIKQLPLKRESPRLVAQQFLEITSTLQTRVALSTRGFVPRASYSQGVVQPSNPSRASMNPHRRPMHFACIHPRSLSSALVPSAPSVSRHWNVRNRVNVSNYSARDKKPSAL